MSKSDNREAWYMLLTRWQLAWSRLSGHLPYFQLAISDYRARVKRLVEESSNELLFTSYEIDKRRGQMLSGVAREMLDDVDRRSSRWSLFRWRGRGKGDRRRKNRKDKKDKNGSQQDAIPGSAPFIKELTPAELFSPAERERRLASRLKSLKIEFRKTHRHMLDTFKRYHQLVAELRPDDIDREIELLEMEYLHRGRKREWFTSYLQMVQEVAMRADDFSTDIEFNEDPIRLLQGDFLTTMRTRLDTFSRLQSLRDEAFRLGDLESIRLFSYFRMKKDSGGSFVDPPREFEDVQQFLSSLEYQLGLFKARHAAKSDETPIFPALVAQGERLVEWENFRRKGEMDQVQLRRIANQCEEWRASFDHFEAEVELIRMESGGLHNSHREMEARRQFLENLCERIDQEIKTDIAFQESFQMMVRSGEESEALQLVLEQLKLARNRNDSPDIIRMIKSDFVDRFGISDESSEVIPLFRKK